MADLFDNPMGTDGFEFVEYTAPDPEQLRALFARMGFPVSARHRSKNVTLHRQGDINFVINAEPQGFGQQFARAHGPSACAMAFRVKDAAAAFRRAVQLGAKPVETAVGPMELRIPAIEGIGGSLIYLVDRYGDRTIYDVDFQPVKDPDPVRAAGLTLIDHLTHNVSRGHMDKWAGFYERLFNFREIRYFDIEGKKTGLFSKAMTSPCGKIRIPINESQDDKSQIEEYIREYHGEGIQHIALFTERHLCDGRRPALEWRRIPGHAGDLLRGRRRARRRTPRVARTHAGAAHPDRRQREGRHPAADLHPERHRPDLLRDHPEEGQRGFRGGQLPRALRVHRARPGAARRHLKPGPGPAAQGPWRITR